MRLKHNRNIYAEHVIYPHVVVLCSIGVLKSVAEFHKNTLVCNFC